MKKRERTRERGRGKTRGEEIHKKKERERGTNLGERDPMVPFQALSAVLISAEIILKS